MPTYISNYNKLSIVFGYHIFKTINPPPKLQNAKSLLGTIIKGFKGKKNKFFKNKNNGLNSYRWRRFFSSSIIMVNAQEACAFANTQKNNENQND